ncbi:MAG: hypothetical protein JXJ22_02035 [Bacteroidales bacterium]|nr:hypothetical protein [Bacteroidales bacterium]
MILISYADYRYVIEMIKDDRFVEIVRKRNNLWIIRFKSVEPSQLQFEEFLNQLYSLYSQNSQLILIFDGSKARYIHTRLRHIYAKWIERYEDMIKSTCLLHIYVSNNLVTNYIFRELFLAKAPPVLYNTVRNMDEALRKAFESGKVSRSS